MPADGPSVDTEIGLPAEMRTPPSLRLTPNEFCERDSFPTQEGQERLEEVMLAGHLARPAFPWFPWHQSNRWTRAFRNGWGQSSTGP